MAMDVRSVEVAGGGRFVVCGRSAVRLKERFPEIELRVAGKRAEVEADAEVVRMMLARNPRTRNVFVDIVTGAERVARAVVAARLETATETDYAVALARGWHDVDEWEDPQHAGYGHAYMTTIVGDAVLGESLPLTSMHASFCAGYREAWLAGARAWLKTSGAARRLQGTIVVDILADGTRIEARVDRGVVMWVEAPGARAETWEIRVGEVAWLLTELGFDAEPLGPWMPSDRGVRAARIEPTGTDG